MRHEADIDTARRDAVAFHDSLGQTLYEEGRGLLIHTSPIGFSAGVDRGAWVDVNAGLSYRITERLDVQVTASAGDPMDKNRQYHLGRGAGYTYRFGESRFGLRGNASTRLSWLVGYEPAYVSQFGVVVFRAVDVHRSVRIYPGGGVHAVFVGFGLDRMFAYSYRSPFLVAQAPVYWRVHPNAQLSFTPSYTMYLRPAVEFSKAFGVGVGATINF